MRRSFLPSLGSIFLFLLGACSVGDNIDEGNTFGATLGNATTPNGGDASATGGNDDAPGDDDDDAGESATSGSATGASDPTNADTDEPPDECGDGVVTGNEVCEANVLGEATCTSLGFDAGTLGCSGDCLDYDTSGCIEYVCGNGIIEGTEVCDQNDLGGQSCQGQGFDEGPLGCAADCMSFDTSNCVTWVCGNGIIEGNEVCDRGNLAGQSCQTQGFNSGTLACSANCMSFNTAGCSNQTPGGTCCVAHGGIGCSVFSIQQCVCAFDPFCCNTAWDSACVSGAINSCNAGC